MVSLRPFSAYDDVLMCSGYAYFSPSIIQTFVTDPVEIQREPLPTHFTSMSSDRQFAPFLRGLQLSSTP